MPSVTKLDILAIGVHPDDVEISAAGTLISHIKAGKRAGILHLTKGEMGTRGSAKQRLKEAETAAGIIGAAMLDNAGMADVFFTNDPSHQLRLIEKIRLYRPEIVLCNALTDRHPDHGRASLLVSDACFYSGLVKIRTKYRGKAQAAWRPRAVYHYIQDRHMRPDLVVDISPYFDQKMKAVKAYRSQFFDPDSPEPPTYISTKAFIESIHNRNAEMGRIIGVDFAEGFVTERYPGIKNLFDLI
jgi:N-acetylglucosamine malate deacetylase 1